MPPGPREVIDNCCNMGATARCSSSVLALAVVSLYSLCVIVPIGLVFDVSLIDETLGVSGSDVDSDYRRAESHIFHGEPVVRPQKFGEVGLGQLELIRS